MKLSLRLSIFIGILLLLVTGVAVLLAVNFLTQALLVLAGICASMLFARSIAKPLVAASNTLKDISMSEGDLTRRIETRSKDEVGELARHFNLTMEKIDALVRDLKKQSGALGETDSELSANITQTVEAIKRISANIRALNAKISGQGESVSAANTAAGGMNAGLEDLNARIAKQAERVETAETSAKELLESFQSVTRTLAENADNVSALADASEAGRGGILQVVENIKEISRESVNLQEINGLLQTIASQTNLLSMNAAIEAAHAGEAGRGFAVVADEISKLATSSAEQSKAISSMLQKIAALIKTASASTDNVLEKFTALEKDVALVAGQESALKGAMETQSENGRQVVETVSAALSLTGELAAKAEASLEAGKRISGICANLEALSAEISSGMIAVENGTAQIGTAAANINTISGRNQENINILVKGLGRFKTDDGQRSPQVAAVGQPKVTAKPPKVTKPPKAAASPEAAAVTVKAVPAGVFQYKWDSSFSVGYPLIDEQHQELFVKVNALLAAIQLGQGKDQLKKAVDFLSDYTVKHFFDEEQLQKKYRYPDHPNHHKYHEFFKGTVRDFSKELIMRGANEKLADEMRKKLGSWLIDHIKVQDVKLGAYLRSKAAQGE